MEFWKWVNGRQKNCTYKKFTLWFFRVYNYGFDGYILKYEPNQVLPTHRDHVKGGYHYRMNIGWGRSLFVIKSKIWRFKLGKLSIYIFRPDIYPHSLIINERTYKLSLGFVKYKQ